MKRFCVFFLILLTLTSWIPNLATAQDEADWMPDANLRTAVRASLELADAEALTQAKTLDLTVLKAAGRNISDLTGLQHATNLTELRLASNQISDISPLSELTSLTTLRLQDNAIASLPSLESLQNLTELFLSANQISDVAPLTALVSLGTLRLAGNPITNAHVLSSLIDLNDVDVDITILEPLQAVLPQNPPPPLTTVPDRTPQVRDAIVAAVPGVNDAADVTEADLAAITSLRLYLSRITALSTGDFDGLSSLETLHLYGNLLTSLPADVFSGLSSLGTLHLYGNLLTDLPDDIFSELSSLTELLLYDNRLESLPEDVFSGLSALNTLYLHGNQLTSLPDGVFSGLSSLTSLKLHGNQLESLPAGIFSGLSALNTLDLGNENGGNQLESLPDGVFSGLSSLISLSLAHNELTDLPDGVFSGLSALNTLLLHGNELESLPAGIFSGLSALAWLHLQDNQLESLPAGIFSDLSALTWLQLHGNSVAPLPLTVSLELVGEGEFKATIHTGAPFDIVLPVSVTNGSIDGGETTLTIPKGNVESTPLTVSRPPDTTEAVTVDIGTLPEPLGSHSGYSLVKSTDLPLEVIGVIVAPVNIIENRAPVFTEGRTATRSVAENTASGVNIGAAIAATDADDDTLTYFISGTDADIFSIDETSGQLETKAVLDYETKSSYAVEVTATDGSLTATIPVTITVTDVAENRAPIFADGITTTRSVAENTASGVNIGSAIDATDADNDALTYSLSGTDAAFFTIDGTTGRLRTNAPLDYETKSTYILTVEVSDGNGGTDSITATINVMDVDDYPLAGRTQQVQDAIVNAVPGVNAAADVTAAHLAAIDVLNLSADGITTLKAGDFDGLTALTDLDLSHNALATLPTGIFDENTALTDLRLHNNALSSLSAGVFDGLTDLTTLVLSQNQLSSLPVDVFDGLTALTKLDLPSNALSSLPVDVFDGLTALITLDLHSNALSSLSASVFDGLTALITLDLHSNALSSLSASVFDGLTALTTLDLSNNALSSLSAGVFDGLIALEYLDLSNNALSSLSAGVFDGLTALEYLDLHSNALSSLPVDIFDGLTALTELDLSNNGLSSLPVDIFDGLAALIYLSLSGNTVNPLPVTVALEEVVEGQFKATAHTGAPFAIVLPITVTNGSIDGSTTTITISKGSAVSGPLTVTRTSGTTATVTVNIGDPLPELPSSHSGYALIKSSDLPLVVIGEVENSAPTFTEVDTAIRSVAENTASGVNIGTPIAATDPDTGNTLTYTLGGADADAFGIDEASGQLRTLASLDYEIKTTYSVTITVSDGNGGSASITGQIEVEDVGNSALLSDRTPQVRDAIVIAVPDVSDYRDVTESDLAAITSLNLGQKSITSLKAGDFDGLTGLTELDLSFNQLTSLPDRIFSELSALTTLKLYRNQQLKSLPDGIFNELSELTELDLHYNGLTSLPDDPFNGLSALTTLNLSINGLTGLSDGVFSGLTELTELYLNENQLQSLPAGVFSNLTALTKIVLSGNRLTSLPADVFSGSTGLTTLIIWNNQLTSLPDGVFSGLTSLTLLELPGNSVNPLPLTVSLEQVAEGQFKATAHAGAPFNIVLPLTVTNASIDGGATTVTIPTGGLESESLTVIRTPGTTAPVTVDIGDPLPEIPENDRGYGLVKSTDLPVEVVGDINSAPVFTEGENTTRTVVENTASGVNIGAAITATDADNDPLTYILGGTDTDVFGIDEASGQLKTSAALDYETKSSYEVTVSVSDGNGGSDAITVTIDITDIDDTLPNNAPVFTEGETATRSVVENSAADINIGSPVLATDDDGDLLTYSLDDASAFSIDTATGQLKTSGALDYETQTTYEVTVSVSDGNGGSDSITVTINVTDVGNPALLSDRTSEVRDAIVDAVPGVSSAADMTEAHLAGITSLGLSNSGLSSLQAGDFEGISALTGLFLSDNALTSLPHDVFNGLTELTELSLFGNQLSNLPEDVFSGLTTLTTLKLNRNQLTSLPAGVFSGLTSLTSLKLIRNPVNPLPLTVSLERVAEGQFKATAAAGAPFDIVLSLSITNGSIDDGVTTTITIPTGNVESEPLTVTRTPGTTAPVTVDIGDPLPTIPATHSGYSLVKSSDLPLEVIKKVNEAPVFTDGETATRAVAENTAAGEDIGTTVSATDADNDTLTYTLSGTDAASFSIVSTSGQLQTSAALDYETKSSYTVTVEVSDGPHTDTITVTINVADVGDPALLSDRTEVVKEAILAAMGVTDDTDVTAEQLAAISTLDLIKKGITELKASDFAGLTGLATLKLNNNQLSSLPDGIFDGLTALTTLNMNNNNQLSSLDADIFEGLTKLAKLNLSNNAIGSLPADIFDGLTALTTLRLAGNGLSSLDADIFEGLTKLTLLYLQGNSLSSLPDGIFEGLTALTSLYLQQDNTDDPLPFTVSLQKVAEGQFKVVAPAGAPFEIVLPLTVTNGSISSGATDITIPIGGVESEPLTVIRNANTIAAVTVDIGDPLPGIPAKTNPSEKDPHQGYELVKSDDLPLAVISAVGAAPSSRTPEVPKVTALQPNYPNPFNPETWIPYQLAKPADVTLTIYDMRGVAVRRLALGHQDAGIYQNRSRAAHWDGRNDLGEEVATGIYFYALTAGDFTATRKMLILK